MALALLAGCTSKNGMMVTKDKDGSKMLVGIYDEDALMNDKAFAWFREGYDTYRPDTAAVRKIAKEAGSLRIEVWGGTWCDDTHELLPGFYKVTDAAHIAPAQISLHLVNRDKKTKDGSAEKYHITRVPTFIIFRGDKQIGRVVESVKVNIEADIVAILSQG
jgi:hypothetical protein